jgi:hypothetical protein
MAAAAGCCGELRAAHELGPAAAKFQFSDCMVSLLSKQLLLLSPDLLFTSQGGISDLATTHPSRAGWQLWPTHGPNNTNVKQNIGDTHC